MSGPSFNITDRQPHSHTTSTVDVYSINDLPDAITAADGVSRVPLVVNTKYLIHVSFVWPRILFPQPLGIAGFEVVEIVGARLDVNLLIAGDSTPHFWGRGMSAVSIAGVSVIDVGNSGAGRSTVLFDFVGQGSNPNISFDFIALFNFLDLGRIVNMPQFHPALAEFGNEKGLVIRTKDVFSTIHSINQYQQQSFGFARKTPGLMIQGDFNSFSMNGGNIANIANDSAIYIDSGQIGSIDIDNISYAGSTSGEFFRPDISESLTAMAAATNIPYASVTDLTLIATPFLVVNAVNIGLTGSIFDSVAAHGFSVGDSVVHTGYANGAYNGTFTITRIINANEYNVAAITFISDDSGTSTVNQFGFNVAASHNYVTGDVFRTDNGPAYDGLHTVKSVNITETQIVVAETFIGVDAGDIVNTTITAVAHGLSYGETVAISGTTSYNGTFEVRYNPTDDTFQVPVAFVANDATGTVVSTGKDGTVIGITSLGNGAQKDSMSIGSAFINDNSTATVISTINTFTDFNLNASAAAGSNIERWTLTNTTTGEIRYDGDKPFVGKVVASISAASAGGAQEFQFRLVKNGSPLTDAIEAAAQLGADTGALTLIAPVSAIKNDLFRLQVENVDGTSNLTVRFLSMEIS